MTLTSPTPIIAACRNQCRTSYFVRRTYFVSAAQKEADKLHKEVEDLKRENHLLRLEKDEIAQAMRDYRDGTLVRP